MCEIDVRFSVRPSFHSQFTSNLAFKSIYDFFSETTASVNLKFHMQHDQTPRLQNSKILSGREFKMAAITKNSKTNEMVIFSRTARYNWLKFCMKYE